MKRPFNLETELQKAWDWCWNYYCEPSEYREEIYDEDGMPTGKYKGETRTIAPRQSWLTATDLERRLRAAAAESLAGESYGSFGADAWGRGPASVRISTGSPGGLLEAVRHWLSGQIRKGKLTGHNFGRGHCSGLRCRPVGLGLTDAEQQTIERREKIRKGEVPIHFRDEASNSWNAKSLCTKASRAAQLAKAKGYRFARHNARSSTQTTTTPEKVTCPRCLKLLAKVKVKADKAFAAEFDNKALEKTETVN